MMISPSVPERNVRIWMDLLKVLGQERVRVEHVAIGTPNRFIALHFHDTEDDMRTSWYPVFICWALEKQLYILNAEFLTFQAFRRTADYYGLNRLQVAHRSVGN